MVPKASQFINYLSIYKYLIIERGGGEHSPLKAFPYSGFVFPFRGKKLRGSMALHSEACLFMDHTHAAGRAGLR